MATWYISPTGTGDGTAVGTPTNWSNVITIWSDGDTVMFLDGNYGRLAAVGAGEAENNITIRAYNVPAQTVLADPGMTSHPARLNQTVIINQLSIYNVEGWTIQYLHFKYNRWVETTLGQTFTSVYGSEDQGFLSLIGTTKNITIEDCEFSWGYGPSQDPFVTTGIDPNTGVMYPEFQSGAFATVYPTVGNVMGRGDPWQAWWIQDDVEVVYGPGSTTPGPGYAYPNPTGRAYNTIGEAPTSLYNAYATDCQVRRCYFHDVQNGLSIPQLNAAVVVDQCWFSRVYRDNFVIAPNSASYNPATATFQFTRNIIEKPFGKGDDSGNPHSDGIQSYSNILNNTNTPTPFTNYVIERNFVLMRNEDRGTIQSFFLQGPAGHNFSTKNVAYYNTRFRHNTVLANGGKTLVLDPIVDGLIEKNIGVTNPLSSSSTTQTISLGEHPNTKYTGKARVRLNIAEAFGMPSSVLSQNNVTVGNRFVTIPRTTVFAGDFSTQTHISAVYAACDRQAAYDTHGPQFTTLSSLINDPLSSTDIEVWVGFPPLRQRVPGTTGTSTAHPIQGPDGSTVNLSVNTGQIQIETYAGVVTTAWTNGPVNNVAVGSYVRLRHTTSLSYNTTVTQTLTLTHGVQGAKTANFTSTTQSNVQLPGAAFDLTTYHSMSGNASAPAGWGTGAAASKVGTFAMRFILNTTQGATNCHLLGQTSGSTKLSIRTLSPTNKLRILGRNPGAVTVFGGNGLDSNISLVNGREYLFIMSWDLAQPATKSTYRLMDMTDGTVSTPVGTPTVLDVPWQWDEASTLNNSGINHLPNTGPSPTIFFQYLDILNYYDLTDPVVLDEVFQKFSNAYLGPNGEGPSGSIPLYFAAGPVSDWNHVNGINRGTGKKLIKVAGTVTAHSTPEPAYPPNLDLVAERTTAGEVILGEHTDILIYPEGYGVVFNVTPATDKDGTFDESPVGVPAGTNGVVVGYTPNEVGTHTITFTPSNGYTAPDPVVIEVVSDAPPPPPPPPAPSSPASKGQLLKFLRRYQP